MRDWIKFPEKSQQQPALDNKKGPILLYKNAHLLVSQITGRRLNGLSVEVMFHLPYSSNSLSLTDNHLLKHFGNILIGRTLVKQERYDKVAFTYIIVYRTLNFYAKGTNGLGLRWRKCPDARLRMNLQKIISSWVKVLKAAKNIVLLFKYINMTNSQQTEKRNINKNFILNGKRKRLS